MQCTASDLVTEGKPSAMSAHSETASVVVDSGVVDVREHVIGGDDVMMGVVRFQPIRSDWWVIAVT